MHRPLRNQAVAGSAVSRQTLFERAPQARGQGHERLIADWNRSAAVSVRRTTAIAVSADPALAASEAARAGEQGRGFAVVLTPQNAAPVEESAAGTGSLSFQAQQLAQSVQRLRLPT